jgi:transposase InsO family protein
VDATALGTAAIAALAGIAGTYVALRRDQRESRAQAITEAKDTIDLLREQTNILKEHGEAREEEWRRLEQIWHDREARLEKRIEGVEGDYRRLVLTVTSMGLCANAPTCANYNPGDRRVRRVAQPVERELPLAEESIEG